MELNRVRKFVINNCFETIPPSRLLIGLSFNDDMIFKSKYNDVDDILDKLHHLRKDILYMIGFEKLVREEKL